MSPAIAFRSRFRPLVPLFLATVLAACGGGGGGGAGPGPEPTPTPGGTPGTGAGTLALADCLQNPATVTNTYLGTARSRVDQRAATFLGEAVTGRFEYANASATTPLRAVYFRADPATQTVATLGREVFDGAGTVVLREQLQGLVSSAALAAGASETVTYTVRTLLAPTPTADRTERVTVVYEGNQAVTLPDPAAGNVSGLRRLDTCRLRVTVESTSGGALAPVTVETVHLAPGVGVVKSYSRSVLPTARDVNQTYLTELAGTTGSLATAPSTADAAPSLAQCAAAAPGLAIEITASDAVDARTALRSTAASVFEGVEAIAIEQRRASDRQRSSIDYVDRRVGFFAPIGTESLDPSTGTEVAVRRARSGRPDLRTVPLFATASYAETFTTLNGGGAATTSNDSFRFDGFAKVVTPAGTFDTCKVTFTYGAGGVATETYYHAPNFHWVRLDYTLTDGRRFTREVIAR